MYGLGAGEHAAVGGPPSCRASAGTGTTRQGLSVAVWTWISRTGTPEEVKGGGQMTIPVQTVFRRFEQEGKKSLTDHVT
jgi:hypothetical protein